MSAKVEQAHRDAARKHSPCSIRVYRRSIDPNGARECFCETPGHGGFWLRPGQVVPDMCPTIDLIAQAIADTDTAAYDKGHSDGYNCACEEAQAEGYAEGEAAVRKDERAEVDGVLDSVGDRWETVKAGMPNDARPAEWLAALAKIRVELGERRGE